MATTTLVNELPPGVRKTATLLFLLPAEERQRVLGKLDEAHRQQCLNLLESLQELRTEDLLQLAIEELEAALVSPHAGDRNQEGFDHSELETHAEPPAATESGAQPQETGGCPESADDNETDDPLRAIAEADPDVLAAALANEPPGLAAVVLQMLPPEQVAAVMSRLPNPEQVFLALVNPPRIPPRSIQGLLARLSASLSNGSDGGEDPLPNGQLQQLITLVRALPASVRTTLLARLKEVNPELAQQVSDNLYVFEDLLRVADSCVQTMLGELELRVVATALSGAPPELKSKIARNLSKRVRESLFEELEMLGTLPPSKVKEARQQFIKKMLELDEKGELILLE